MKALAHGLAGGVSLLIISVFWLATISSELSGHDVFVQSVKLLVPWGFLVLIQALAVTGGSGFALTNGRNNPWITRKHARMKFAAANGILVLVPAALFLASKAQTLDFDAVFYVVQAVELAAGATNIWLLAMNMRDGLRRRRKQASRREA
ncbi:MAG: hypothetical protein AAGJ68_09705 [Pseudomonadota bacterium]